MAAYTSTVRTLWPFGKTDTWTGNATCLAPEQTYKTSMNHHSTSHKEKSALKRGRWRWCPIPNGLQMETPGNCWPQVPYPGNHPTSFSDGLPCLQLLRRPQVTQITKLWRASRAFSSQRKTFLNLLLRCFCPEWKSWRNYWKHSDCQFCSKIMGTKAFKELSDSKIYIYIKSRPGSCLHETRN